MKKRHRFIYIFAIQLLFLFINIHSVKCQVICDSVFMKEYTSGGQIEPFATKNLTNNEILVAGRATLTPGGSYKAMAVKLSPSGKPMWSITVNGNTDDRFTGIVLLSDGNYLFYGNTSVFGNASKVLLVCISSNGTLIWSRQLGNTSTATNRIKSIMQFTDGDIIGSFNSNDSTAQSNPVVFKMGLNGTLKWAREFDNNKDEGFSSIAFNGTDIYVSGFYTENKKRGVLTILNSADGAVISAQKIAHSDTNYIQQMTNMEIINGEISYGLLIRRVVGSIFANRMVLIKKDIQSGIKSLEIAVNHDYDSSIIEYKRTADESFLILRDNYIPEVLKLNKYLLLQWSSRQSQFNFTIGQEMRGLDLTAAGGCTTAGTEPNFSTPGANKMIVAKTSALGEQGECTIYGFTFGTDTTTLIEEPFTWANTNLLTALVDPITLTVNDLPLNSLVICSNVICTDITPLPPACNKTSLVEYSSPQTTTFTDVINTDDGGKIVIGQMNFNGYMAKFKNNGDIAWSKKVDQVGNTTNFKRIIRSGNNFLAFGNHGYVINHQVYGTINVVKIDDNGTVLFSKELVRGGSATLTDVFATPDSGFVIIINECHGCGYLYSDVIRFDANMNIVWKKELKHFVMAPVYRSLFCTQDAVYIGHDMYDFGSRSRVGVQKLDLATGNDRWSKIYDFGSGSQSFNKMLVSNDTLYAFINRGEGTLSISMLTISSAGNLINSVLLDGDKLVTANSGDYIDFVRPTVTLTNENDFVMSNQVYTPDGKALNLTRFSKNGAIKWSSNYRWLADHFVYNIHTQSNGFVITGSVTEVHPLNGRFNSGFILKTDSIGKIIANATGSCETVTTACVPVNLVVNQSASNIDSVVNLSNFAVYNSTVTEFPEFIDADLFCNQQSNCTPVTVASIGNGCSMQDTLTYYLANNTCGASVIWTFDSSFFSLVSVTGDSLKLLPKKTGASVLTAKVEDACSIVTQTLNVAIMVDAATLNLGNDTLICPGSNIVLKAGAGFKSYLWNNLSTDSTLTVNSPGLYYVDVTDNCGGHGVDSIQITTIDNSLHIAGNVTKCNKDTVVLTATPGFTNYQWTPSAQGIFSNNIARVYPSQTIKYFVQAQKLPGCIAKDSFLLSVINSPAIDLGKDTAICKDNSLTLSATGFTSYGWSNGSNAPSITIFTAGIYFVAATYNNSCISRDTIEVKKYSFIKPFLGNDTSVCANGNYKIKAGNYAQYTWSNGAIGSSIQPLQTGQYWVNVTDINGCQGGDTINIINMYKSPGNFLNDHIAICWNEFTVLQPTANFVKYLWSDGSVTSSISVNKFGLYILNATDINGCKGNDTISVIKKPDCKDTIYIANAFTPNGDGKNDLFKPIVLGQTEKYFLMIYNRYGQPVFSTTDLGSGWDGKFKGQLQPGGNYIYSLHYKLSGFADEYKSGSVILIR